MEYLLLVRSHALIAQLGLAQAALEALHLTLIQILAWNVPKIALVAVAQIQITAFNVQLDHTYLELHACHAIQYAYHAPPQHWAVQAVLQANSTMRLCLTVVLALVTVLHVIQVECAQVAELDLCLPIQPAEVVLSVVQVA